jgi:hypothetical protein
VTESFRSRRPSLLCYPMRMQENHMWWPRPGVAEGSAMNVRLRLVRGLVLAARFETEVREAEQRLARLRGLQDQLGSPRPDYLS